MKEDRVLYVRLNGKKLRARWPGKRWHGAYSSLDEIVKAAEKEGFEPPYNVEYVDEEK
jgi:hypothetical protein